MVESLRRVEYLVGRQIEIDNKRFQRDDISDSFFIRKLKFKKKNKEIKEFQRKNLGKQKDMGSNDGNKGMEYDKRRNCKDPLNLTKLKYSINEFN